MHLSRSRKILLQGRYDINQPKERKEIMDKSEAQKLPKSIDTQSSEVLVVSPDKRSHQVSQVRP